MYILIIGTIIKKKIILQKFLKIYLIFNKKFLKSNSSS